MKIINIFLIIIIILVISALIGLSIYYNVKSNPTPTSLPEFLGFKKTLPNIPQSENFSGLSTPAYIGIGIGGIFLLTIIIFGLFIFLPNWGTIY